MKEIQLTQGKVAIVDDEDYEWLNQWKWHFSNGYAQRNASIKNKQKRCIIKMHRQIMNLLKKDGKQVDHINQETLDNRRKNLRLSNKSTNGMNRGKQSNNKSGFKGVSWSKPRKMWIAQIRLDGKQVCLGVFSTPESAHAAYCDAAIKQHGEFANLGSGCVILKGGNVSR